MRPVTQIKSHTAILATKDIDTDQIFPARFLTTTTRDGLGKHLFADLRYGLDGSKRPEFPLNTAAAQGCEILVGGNNFGCGSSREHAPWALLDYGFKAIISTGIADIFRDNSLKNGLLPVVVDAGTHRWLLDNPGAEVCIDVRASTLALPDGRVVDFPIDRFARHCLVEGIDQMGYIQQYAKAVRSFEQKRLWTP